MPQAKTSRKPKRQPPNDEQLLAFVAMVEELGSQHAAARAMGRSTSWASVAMAEARKRGLTNYRARRGRLPGNNGKRTPPAAKPQQQGTEAQLWKAYLATDRQDEEARNALAVHYLRTVQLIAAKLAGNLPGRVMVEDLVQAGACALLKAIERFEPEQHYKFWTFANQRVHGAMIDYLREVSTRPRTIVELVQRVDQAELELEQQLRRRPTSEEIRERSGLNDNDWRLADEARETSGDRVVFRSERSDHVQTVLDLVPMADRVSELERDDDFRQLTRPLSLESQTVLYLRYHRGQTMKQIGQVLNLSESRVSQIHADAIVSVRRQLDAAA